MVKWLLCFLCLSVSCVKSQRKRRIEENLLHGGKETVQGLQTQTQKNRAGAQTQSEFLANSASTTTIELTVLDTTVTETVTVPETRTVFVYTETIVKYAASTTSEIIYTEMSTSTWNLTSPYPIIEPILGISIIPEISEVDGTTTITEMETVQVTSIKTEIGVAVETTTTTTTEQCEISIGIPTVTMTLFEQCRPCGRHVTTCAQRSRRS